MCNHNSDSVIQHSADIAGQLSNDNETQINTGKAKLIGMCFCEGNTHIESFSRININGSDIDESIM